jgi:hypothetical protein
MRLVVSPPYSFDVTPDGHLRIQLSLMDPGAGLVCGLSARPAADERSPLAPLVYDGAVLGADRRRTGQLILSYRHHLLIENLLRRAHTINVDQQRTSCSEGRFVNRRR